MNKYIKIAKNKIRIGQNKQLNGKKTAKERGQEAYTDAETYTFTHSEILKKHKLKKYNI